MPNVHFFGYTLMMPIVISLHVLSAIIWVGGMFFAHQVLRPAALQLDPKVRLPLWARTFARFFPWVWAAIIVLPLSGYWMIFTQLGGMRSLGMYVHIMQTLGLVMILIFLHVFFGPYRRFRQALAQNDLPAAGQRLAQIRRLVGVNLILGLIVAVVAVGGRYW